MQLLYPCNKYTFISFVTDGARGGCRFGDLRSVTLGPRLWERPVRGLFFGLDLVLGWISSRCSFDSSRRRGITGSNFSLVGEGSSAPSPARDEHIVRFAFSFSLWQGLAVSFYLLFYLPTPVVRSRWWRIKKSFLARATVFSLSYIADDNGINAI